MKGVYILVVEDEVCVGCDDDIVDSRFTPHQPPSTARMARIASKKLGVRERVGL